MRFPAPSAFRQVALLIPAGTVLLAALGCGGQGRPGSAGQAKPQATASAPRVGQIRPLPEPGFIYSGAAWIPRDRAPEILAEGLQAAVAAAAAPCTSKDCNPAGAHAVHTGFGCRTCHQIHSGVVAFDPLGAAVIGPTADNPAPPAPSFDPVAKTCSNVACHGTPAGVFSYYFQGGDGEAELRTAAYGGYVATPNWYTQGAGCSACHGAPPATGAWHSGQHAPFIPGANTCQFCHPDASGSAATGVALTQPALHRNGTVNVQARFTSACFGCH